jgi:hypothetical protein
VSSQSHGARTGAAPPPAVVRLCDRPVRYAVIWASGPALVLAATDNGGQWKLPGTGEAVTLAGPLAQITAYLTGRSHSLTTAGGGAAPVLAPWL